MNILVIGGGGREHALCWKIRQFPLCERLYCAPGNAGIAQVAQCRDVAIDDIDGLVRLAREIEAGFVVIGPEAPLVAGLADRLAAQGILVFGPSAAAARLEGSKAFTKDLCKAAGIPTAAYERFTDADAAKAYLEGRSYPLVIKADGLAAGKGVVIAEDPAQAEAAADDMLSGAAFGSAGAEIVIEDFLQGEEVSFFALCDGKTAVPLLTAQDHKRAYDGDKGPNTGGMGAYAPARLASEALQQKIMTRIIEPTLAAMADRGAPFAGVLYAGLMVDEGGDPSLIEYNVRFGDPECQAIMTMMDGDLLPLLLAAAKGTLAQADAPSWFDGAALCVVMAAKGYPGVYEKGTVIRNLDEAAKVDGARLFHAGTKAGADGAVLAAGGRVLNICGGGATLKAAQQTAYAAAEKIDWPEGFYRRDIGWRAL